MIPLKSRVDFTGGWTLPSLRMTEKIINDDIHYLLANGTLWQTELMSSRKRIDCSDDERDARRFLWRLVGHFAKSVKIIAV
jgi:hypothetical protein